MMINAQNLALLGETGKTGETGKSCEPGQTGDHCHQYRHLLESHQKVEEKKLAL